MSSKVAKDAGWSFSLRSYNCQDYDSSSDSDSSQCDDLQPGTSYSNRGQKTGSSTEEACLLGDLDLASRVDAATYKPSPWSIAKANAAARAPNTPVCQPKAAPQPTKITASKSSALVSSLTPALKPKIIDFTHKEFPTHSHDMPSENDAHIASDETLVDAAVSDANPKLHDPRRSIGLLLSPVPLLPRSIATQGRADVSSSFANPAVADSSHVVSSQSTLRQEESASSKPFRREIWPHTTSSSAQSRRQIPPEVNKPLAKPDLRSLLLKPSTVGRVDAFIATDRPSLQLTPNTIPRISNLRVPGVSGTLCALPVPSHPPPIPRPPRSVQEEPSPNLAGGKSAYSRLYPPVQSSPIPQHLYSSTNHSSATNDLSKCHSTSSPIRSNRLHNEQNATPESSRSLSRFALRQPNSSQDALDRPVASNSVVDVSFMSGICERSIKGPQTPHVSSGGPSSSSPSHPTQPPVKHRPTSTKKRDVYEAFGSPDAAWSTLPAKKRLPPGGNREGKVNTAGPFRLPLRLGDVLRRHEAQEKLAAKEDASVPARRAMTYLPPPPKDGNRGFNTMNANKKPMQSLAGTQSMAERSKEVDLERSRHPPTAAVFQPLAIRRAAAPLPSPSTYKCPTQRETERRLKLSRAHAPDGSTVHRASQRDMTMEFDAPGLSQRYPFIRRKVAERKRLSLESWDLLGLSSCGVVYRDEWRNCDRNADRKTRTKPEVAIPIWPDLASKQPC